MIDSRAYTFIKYLAVFGVLLAVYLLWEQLARPAFQPCNINATVNCNAVVSGAVSKTLGVPTPLYGLIGYIVIFFAAMMKNKKLLLGMAAFGLLFCLYIAYRELIQLKVICPVCIGCQIDMIATFILALMIYRRKPA